MSDDRIRVAYVGGFGRSGSTLLDNLLGQMPGITAVGELMYVWDRGVIENRLCGCRKPFRTCEFWSCVFQAAFGGFDKVDAYAMVELRRRSDRPRYNALLIAGKVGRDQLRRRAGYRAVVFERLYKAIVEVSACQVVLDSSKTPCQAELLKDMATVEPYVIHLVRDPRAVAYSWQRKKSLEDGGGDFDQCGVARSALLWSAEHAALRRRWSRHPGYFLLQYEQLLKAPQNELSKLVRFLGLTGSGMPPISADGTIDLKPCHGIGGNSSRFRTGPVKLRMDDEWKEKLEFGKRMSVTAITAPLLMKYGYPIVRVLRSE
jgi:hypothetical protein